VGEVILRVEQSGPEPDPETAEFLERATQAMAEFVGAQIIVEGPITLPNCFSPEDFPDEAPAARA
jgi:hypothetical protein